MGQPVDVAVAPLSFDEFFRAEYTRVVGLAAVLCGQRAIAEELAQDAFFAAYRHWDAVADYQDPAGWIRRVVVNFATSTLRRRAREARALTRLAQRPVAESTALTIDGDFWQAVRALPRRQAQCIALHYLDDRSADEIAAILHIEPVTVRVHLHAARSTLAAKIGEALDEEAE